MNIVAMTRAFALVSLLEFLLLLLFASLASCVDIESKVKFDLPVQLSLLWLLWVIVATFWGDAQLSDKWSEVWSWRKIYLLIFGVVLFRDPKEKVGALCTLEYQPFLCLFKSRVFKLN